MTSLPADPPLYTQLLEWQTRLISLLPGRTDEPLKINLCVVDLIHAEGVVVTGTSCRVEYEALSYTWGDPKAVQPIELNNRSFSVTENLYDALVTLRNDTEARWLWIDAICVNQTDLQEKSRHLSKIFLIFRKASRVLVFLGRSGPDTTYAIEHLRAIENIVSLQYDNNELIRVYNGLRDLWSRPWLWRIWVRQEVFAARKIHAFCDEHNIEWNNFTDLPGRLNEVVAEMHRRGFSAETVDKRKFRTFENLWYLDPDVLARILNEEYPDARSSVLDRNSKEDDCSTDIVQVLKNNVGCEMTDPRDVIYGILGMTKTKLASERTLATNAEVIPGHIPELTVDYSKDLSSVFEDVAKYVLYRDRSLHLLYLTGHCGVSNDLELPTWCPDWRYENDDTISELNDEIDEFNLTHGLMKRGHLEGARHFGLTPRELLIEGIVLGSVKLPDLSGAWPYCMCNHIMETAMITHGCHEPLQPNPKLPYFQSHQKNASIEADAEAMGHLKYLSVTEQRIVNLFGARPLRLACRCHGMPTLQYITVAESIEIMFRHFWAVPKDARPSDLLVAASGGFIPVVLRRETSGLFKYIGPATLCQGPFRSEYDTARASWQHVPCLYLLISQLIEARAGSLRRFVVF